MTKKLLIILKITMLISVLFFASCNESSDTATPNEKENTGNDTPTTITDASCTFVFTPGEDPEDQASEDGEENPFDKKRDGTCSVEGDVATYTTTLSFEGGNIEYTVSINQANGIFKTSVDETDEITGKVTVSNDGKKWEWVFLNSTATLEITGDTTKTGDTGNQGTAIGEVIGTAEGDIVLKNGIYAGVDNMTCTLEFEEAGKSPITYNGACEKESLDTVISFRDKEVDPSVFADINNFSSTIEYQFGQVRETSKTNDIALKNPGAITKISRSNNVWEGKITTADGKIDLLKLTIKTQDKVVPAPADSKPCQFVKKQIYVQVLRDYTLDGNCMLTYDTDGTTVTKLDFTSSLANPLITASLPAKSTAITEESLPNISKDYSYRAGSYLYLIYTNLTKGASIIFDNDNNNTFTIQFLDNGNANLLKFDIVLTD